MILEKFTKIPKKQLTIISAVIFALIPIVCYFSVEYINEVLFWTQSKAAIAANLVLYYCLFLILFALSNRSWFALLTGSLLMEFCAVANHFVQEFRGTPALPWDLFSIGTALSVTDNYDFVLTSNIWISIVICVVLVLLGLCTNLRLKPLKIRLIADAVTVGVVVAVLSLMFSGDFLKQHGIIPDRWNQDIGYQKFGLFLGFTDNLQYLFPEAPEGYSAEKAEQILADAQPEITGKPEVQAKNIIVIMNESLSDLREVGDFETNKEFLKNFYSLKENVIRGNVYVSIFGGSTANTEYEFLTGNTMAFLPEGSIPYQMYMKNEDASITSYIKEEQDFTNIAIHPYKREGWNRIKAYDALGFDTFLGENDFKKPKRVRKYISDKSSYQKVMDVYEQEKGKPLFFFNVTMQNHGGYTNDWKKQDVEALGLQGSYPMLNQYLSLVKRSDDAFPALFEYFENVEEPTAILIFGDHQPKVEYELWDELLGVTPEHYTTEDHQKSFFTPFLLWTNYDIEEKEYEYISANYLSVLLSQTAGLPLSPYQNYLAGLMEQYPVVNRLGYLDSEHKWHSPDEMMDEPALQEYRILEHYMVFGKD